MSDVTWATQYALQIGQFSPAAFEYANKIPFPVNLANLAYSYDRTVNSIRKTFEMYYGVDSYALLANIGPTSASGFTAAMVASALEVPIDVVTTYTARLNQVFTQQYGEWFAEQPIAPVPAPPPADVQASFGGGGFTPATLPSPVSPAPLVHTMTASSSDGESLTSIPEYFHQSQPASGGGTALAIAAAVATFFL